MRTSAARQPGAAAEAFADREVPLGGIRGMTVRRTLPQRRLPTVGAWCFLDLMGPQHTAMRVLPHPHIGLQTVTWLLHGEVRHRDSVGSDVLVRPGQLNLMTAGRGVAHSEFTVVRPPPDGDPAPFGNPAPLLHGVQLWIALPDAEAHREPGFEQHTALPRYETAGLAATVLVGALGEAASPATVHTPLLGAEVSLAPGGRAVLPLRPDFEHAVLLVQGDARVAGTPLDPGPLLYLGTGRTELPVASTQGTRGLLLGGVPFTEPLVMWWNFVGRSHEQIDAARADWECHDAQRFGPVPGHGAERVPAPPLPRVRLRPRSR